MTTDGRRPSRNARRKLIVWCRTRRSCHHLSTMSAQLTIEKTASRASTALATGPACRTRSRTLLPSASEVGNGDSFVLAHDIGGAFGVSTFRAKFGKKIKSFVEYLTLAF